MNISLLKKAAVNAIGVLVYVLVLGLFFNHAQQIFGTKPDNFLAPALMLILFVVSACITGGLVLGLPAMMYVDGQRRQAVTLLVYTVLSLAVIAALLALGLVLM
jgi:F0F1-type ATP synthase membrane subunit a